MICSVDSILDTESIAVLYGVTHAGLVQPDETLFTNVYRSQLNYYYYKNTWFIPYFTAQFPPNSTVSQAEVNAVCNTDTMCQYDYMVTENQTIAIDTHAITMWDTQLRQMGSFGKCAVSCFCCQQLRRS
jgi:hypothetical protein